MANIVPAILEKTKEAFDNRIFAISRILGVETIQVDFCDGQFVPDENLNIKNIDPLNPAFTWEAHLMMKEPVDFLDYKMVGFKRLIVHYESFGSEQALEEGLDEISKLGLEVALAINPETPVSVLRYFTDTIKYFTLLSVHPGKQGAEFLPESIQRVKELRAMSPHAIIEVDGGVNANNASDLVLAGATVLAVGSGLFATDQLQENYDAIAKASIALSHT